MFREKIGARMTELGMTRKELAEKSGVNSCTVSSYLSGKRAISNKNLTSIIDVLGMKLTPTEKPAMAIGFRRSMCPVIESDNAIQENFKYRMYELGLNQTQVAAMAKVRPQNLSSFLSGIRTIPSDDLERIIDVLQLKIV